jgi:hypothetical protein
MAQVQPPTGSQLKVTAQGVWTTLNDPKQSKIDYEVSQQPDGTTYYRLKGTSTWMDKTNFWSQPWVSIKTPLDPNIAHQQRHKDQYAAYLAARDKWIMTQTYDPKNPTFRDNFPEPKITDYDVGEWANYKPGTTPDVTPGPISPASTQQYSQKTAANNVVKSASTFLTSSIPRGTAQATPTPVPKYKRTRRNPKDSWKQGI